MLEGGIMRVTFKVETIEEYKMCMNMDEKLLKFIDENFELSSVCVKPLNKNWLIVTDHEGESLVFTVKNEQVVWFDKNKIEEVIEQENVDELELETEP